MHDHTEREQPEHEHTEAEVIEAHAGENAAGPAVVEDDVILLPAKPAPRASAAPPLLAKTSRVIPPASAAIPAPVSSVHSAEDVIAAAVAAQTAVAAVPIAAQIVVQTAGARAARDSNDAPAVPVDLDTIVVTAAIPARRAVRSSFPRC